jgi:peptide/nickel transport system ATP-binding protein
MAVLFITHDFGGVSEIADRVAVLRAGELVELGTTRDVLMRPKHIYTRSLIAAVPSLVPRASKRDASAPILLRTEKLTKVYADRSFFRTTRVVRGADCVSVEIRRGEVLGVVGESGSGKSTLARCIARLIEPTEGRIWIGEHDLAHLQGRPLRQQRRRVQIVFQDPYRSLNPRRKVGQSIVEGPMNFGLSHEEALKRAAGLLEFVRLDARALERFPQEFSGGQRQRICIARALAMEPELLIADEAVSALDVSVQAQVLRLLAEVRSKWRLTILFITHDLRVAAQVCDTIAVMQRGRVVEHGEVAQIFAAPQHAYTQTLIEAAPGRHWNFGQFPE